MLISLDIETARGDHVTNPRDHDALLPHKNRITCVGVWRGDNEHAVFRGPSLIADLQTYLYAQPNPELIGHEFRFDIKTLAYHGFDGEWLIDHWTHDTKLMAYVTTRKIPENWLANYEDSRREKNKELPQGCSHRRASLHSLKTLAPYFLQVEPFWEDPTNHDNDDYVIKDVCYTYKLYRYFARTFSTDEMEFYSTKQLPWAKELLRAELEGVRIDTGIIAKGKAEAEANIQKYKQAIESQWSEHFAAYREQETKSIHSEYSIKAQIAVDKLSDRSKADATKRRYNELAQNKIAKSTFELNLNSPKQLMWLLKDRLKYDTRNFLGDESTDKEVLEKLAQEHTEVYNLLQYRKYSKLCLTYYPSYEEFNVNNRIHCGFNTSDTRTGRLSSSFPNLQNQPAETREIFIADPGTVFITRDLSAIEPRLAAYFSEDHELCRTLIDQEDFHGKTASAMFPYIKCHNSEIKAQFPKERGVAKTAGLAVLYGSGKKRVKAILYKAGFTSYSDTDCAKLVKKVRTLYKGVWDFKKWLDNSLESGETIYNLFGRPIRFDNPQEVYMKGFNRLIQGSASDLVQDAILNYNQKCRELGIDSKVLITVHDEIIAQAPEEVSDKCDALLDECMTNYTLDTKRGRIKLLTEGGVAKQWKK